VLTWWRTHGKAIPAWRVAARIGVRAHAQLGVLAGRAFAFALLWVMYDDTQKRARLQIKCRPH
jgi:hypothetical protein